MTPQDTQTSYESVLVANTDIGCDFVSEDIVKVSNRVVDDEGNVSTQIYDKVETWNHKDFFQVKYDGIPYRIEPGKTKHLPRFVAEHFAKHLADHLLQKMEDETGRKGLVQSSIERPKIINSILTELNDSITPDIASTSVDQPEIDTDPVIDEGAIPPTPIGTLKDEPPTLTEILEVAGETKEEKDAPKLEETSIIDDKKPLPTRKQLIELCYQQSIEITGKETQKQLIELLKRG